MDKLDRYVLRKIKDNGNYSTFLKLKSLNCELFRQNSLCTIYEAIKNPERYWLTRENMPFEEFLEKNHLKFCF